MDHLIEAYLATAGAFVALGIYFFALCRWWFHYLTDLATHYDIPERRRRATRAYLIVLLFVAVPLFGAIFWSIAMGLKPGGIIVLGLICSIAPTVIWWYRRIPTLSSLGYGRQRRRR